MTVLTFPTSPTLGQLYNAPNQIQYVFDGVKWTVETVASSSAAVTNSVQDRVAPMFVTGDHTGIAFTYNAATNVMSADVTALVNGVHELTLESTGALTLPTLTVPLEDNANPAGTGQVLKFSDSTQQAIIFGPVSTATNTSAERVIIQGAPGYTGTAGEGGDVYVWAGPGGSANGQGGDIKVRAGQGIGSGNGGYLNFQAGDSNTGNGGYINIESGQSNTYGNGGDITICAHNGGDIKLRTHNSVTSQDWLFGANGATTFPTGGQIANYPDGVGASDNSWFVTPGGEDGNGGVSSQDGQQYIQINNNLPVEIGTSYGTENESIWRFGRDGDLTLPEGGDILDSNGDSVLGGGSYTPDDSGNWNDPTVNTVAAALDELAAKVAALENFEIDGGNANTPALGELLIDGNGA